MSRVTFTIIIDAPDGATINVPTLAREPAGYVPPFADELIPLPDGAMSLPSDPTPFRGAAMAQGPVGNVALDQCPVHGQMWKTIPAGISKKTGAAYLAFRACPVQGCTQRPAA